MRKKYVSPDMKVTEFDTADVLTTSGNGSVVTDPDEGLE